MESEIEHKFLDQNIPRKGKIVRDNLDEADSSESKAPFFSLIEFNLSGLCNRVCVFCPRVDPKIFPNINEHLPVELYEKTMAELAEVDYDGMILYSGFGEPFLYKSIEHLIVLSKQYCPKVRVECVTNGDTVTPDKLQSMFDAGLDTLLISLYDGPEQREVFQGMMAEADVSESQVVLRDRWLPPEENYGITLVNRSGMVTIPDVGVGAITEPLKRRCFYPFYSVVVDYDGSVLLCTHDWGKKFIVGNLNDQTIHELWDNERIRKVRESLANADRGFAPCNGCDADGTLMGGEHFEQWMGHYKEVVNESI
jgi:radical SAM protein with 4Fe4S-binding SPASM domain